ncbi:Methyltransferase domain-containing protein [Alkalibacterium subtropicum]|uniref:Methyltransferase domain-containing protein n=1 Tax=Alkalibacterium subtropicum TaxID=753702 RepID=A0A1I1HKD2_9LACT|nr:methyltransferase domain-containing protein [Alkalibacterium subtropicum]SFC24301.1 Methyltransferase domain-containing protein [Alkalibacterium subtropicum]
MNGDIKNDTEKIEANKIAWGKIAEDHYYYFREKLAQGDFKLNPMVEEEIGDVAGKKILHLQCNTGADSILLARKGAIVTGVDLVPENVFFARKLAEEFGINNATFIESDILKLMDVHEGEYDIVLTTDGVLGWLPDLNKWGEVISHFLKNEGFFYLHDGHPFMLIFDETGLAQGKLLPKYPYFKSTADADNHIGGYASKAKEAENHFWGHQLSTIINGLANGKLYVTHIKEYDRCMPGMGGSALDENGLSYYPTLEGKLPLILSLKAEKKL